MCTGNQDLISQENKEIKSNLSTEDNFIHHKKGNMLKIPQIHKLNNGRDLETISDNFDLNTKNRYNININNNDDEEDFEEQIVMKNKIMYKLDEVDKNLEQTYTDK